MGWKSLESLSVQMSFLKIRIYFVLEKGESYATFLSLCFQSFSLQFIASGHRKKRNRGNSFYKIEKGKKEASTVFHQWNENIFLPSFHSWFIFLFVESAGSASVAFHLLSPGSRPYFSQAILQSAAATNPWAMVTKKEAKLRARRLAEILDCPYEDVSEPISKNFTPHILFFCFARLCTLRQNFCQMHFVVCAELR